MPGRELSVVIPAAGQGLRMRGYGPKPLVRLSPGGETVLARQLRVLRSAWPRAEFVVVVGYEAARVAKALPGWVLAVANGGWEATNVARSAAVGLAAASRPTALVVMGDLVFSPELAGRPLVRAAGGGMSVAAAAPGEMRDDEVGITEVGGLATAFAHGLPLKWAHAACLGPAAKAAFVALAAEESRARHFFYELMNELTDRLPVRVVRDPAARVREIDSPGDLRAARELAAALDANNC